VLCKEDDDYFLITPAEKLKIQVDDAPFVATMVDAQENALVFTTNLEDKFIADAEHPIRVEIDLETQTPRPYVHYRDGLDALISRNAFYDLINLAEEQVHDNNVYLTVNSLGQEFVLGCANPLEDL